MAKRIEKLTKKQTARFEEFRQKWLRIGLATGAADRPEAEAAVDVAYRAAGLEPPRFKIWLQSPMAGAIGAAMLASGQIGGPQVWDQVRDQVRDQVWDQVGGQVWDQVWDQVRGQVRDQVWGQVGGQVGDQVGAQVRDQVRGQVGVQVGVQVGDQVWDQVRDQVGDQVGQAFWSQHEAGWLAWCDFFRHACGLECVKRLAGLNRIAQSSSWCWFFRDAVILTERATGLRRDDRGRLHCENGPALLYPDGWGIWAWHGTRVPREWLETPKDQLDPKLALTHPNVEQRRTLAEILGWRRVLEQLQPKVIDTDPDPEIGQLLRVDLPDAPGSQFLRVKCGTGREFVLPVPDDMRTALQANSWTWGLDVGEYRPEVRT